MSNRLFSKIKFSPCTPSGRALAQRGFTLIELIVVIAIIILLTGALLTRVWFYQEQAEKAAMEQVAAAVQSALILQFAHMVTNNQQADIKKLVSENPTQWLMKSPPNYAGEFFAMLPTAIAPGNWAFDLNSRELIYVPTRTDYFDPGKDGYKWVRFHVRLVYDAVSNVKQQGNKSKDAQVLSGVLFEPSEPYQWLIKEIQ